ncbi:MAG TPA: tetratricopeptide repeat protein, partial [bacterium]
KVWNSLLFLFVIFSGVCPLWAQTAADFYKEANQFYSQKEYARAFDAYKAASLVESNPYRAYAGMGNCSYGQGNKSKALEYYKKSLSLHPDNPPLTQFILKVKGEVAAKGSPFAKGKLFFEQKQYKNAIPYFQETLLDDSRELQAFYDLAYCQYMTRDNPEAALNFAYYGEKKPDTQSKDFALKLKPTLSANDQEWMEDQLTSGPPFSPPFRNAGIGLRIEPNIQLISLKDFKDYVQTLQSQAKQQAQTETSYQLTAKIPSFALGMELNPFFEVSGSLELGVTLDYLFFSEFDAVFQGNSSGSGNGLVDFQIFESGLSLRVNFITTSKGKIGLFADANPSYYFVGLHVANSSINTGWQFIPTTGDFSGSGVGGRFKMGVDWKPLQNSLLSLFVGYQYAPIMGYKGSGITSSGSASSPMPGQLEVQSDSAGNKSIVFVPDGSSAPSGTSLSPLTVDLSGIVFGVDLTVLL